MMSDWCWEIDDVRGLLLWRLWRALMRKLPDHPIYERKRGLWKFHESYVLEPGVIWTYLVSRTLSKEFSDEAFPILATTPPGNLGVSWLICSGTMHRRPMMVQFTFLAVWYLRIISVNLVVFYPPMLPALLAGLFVLHQFDVVLGGLLGMITPTLTHERVGLPVFAALLHIFIVIAVISAMMSLTPIYVRGALLQNFSISLVQLAILVAACELTIRGLWRLLLHRYNAVHIDAAQVLGGTF
jgi:hypothetical protein